MVPSGSSRRTPKRPLRAALALHIPRSPVPAGPLRLTTRPQDQPASSLQQLAHGAHRPTLSRLDATAASEGPLPLPPLSLAAAVAAATAAACRRRCRHFSLATPANDARAAVERQHTCWCRVRSHVRSRTGKGHAGAGSLRRAAGGSTQPTAQACVRLSGQSCACAHGHAPCHGNWGLCTLFAVCAHTAIVGAACRQRGRGTSQRRNSTASGARSRLVQPSGVERRVRPRLLSQCAITIHWTRCWSTVNKSLYTIFISTACRTTRLCHRVDPMRPHARLRDTFMTPETNLDSLTLSRHDLTKSA